MTKRLRVLTLSTFDAYGGAGRAAFRLHQGLRQLGVEAQMLVQSKVGDDYTVVSAAQTRADKLLVKLRPLLEQLPLRFYPQRQQVPFSTAITRDRLAVQATAFNPDIIHLHWVNYGFLNIETLKQFRSPLVWTLHDSWGFTGGCHIPYDCKRYQQACGKCPALQSQREYDVSRWVLHRKRQSWQGLKLTVVTPSQWLADCARSSAVFQNVPVKVIPNGIDTERFRPIDRQVARSVLSLPPHKVLILFGAMDAGDRNKGFHLLTAALHQFAATDWSDRAELLIFGASQPQNPPDFGLPATYMGRIHDDVTLNLLYAAADLFVAPSIQENLPCTVMEALACGTPCVAFKIGGMPDLIDHQQTGYLAEPFVINDLTQGMLWVLEDAARHQKLAEQARQKVTAEFTLETIAQRYIDLYQELTL